MKIKYLIFTGILAVTLLCFGGVVSAQGTGNLSIIAQLQAQIASLIVQIKIFSAALSGSTVVPTATPKELMQSLYDASVNFKNISSWKSDYAFCVNNSPSLLGNTVANIKSGLNGLGYTTFVCNDGDTTNSCYPGSVSDSNWYAIASNGTNYICTDRNGMTESFSDPTTAALANCSCPPAVNQPTVAPISLQIKTINDLNTFIQNTTFSTLANKTNFTANAQDIINAGETLNLNFATINDSNAIGLYIPTNAYLKDRVLIKSKQCARSVSMSHRNRPNSNTPLLNAFTDGDCAIASAAKSLISTLKLGTPSGAPSPTTTVTSNTNGSTTSTVVWNTLFFEWLVKNSGVPINNVSPLDMTSFYVNYIKALGSKTSFTRVQTISFGTWGQGEPFPGSGTGAPITSDIQHIIINTMKNGNVDCELFTTNHFSHIKSVWQPSPPFGDMWLTIDDALSQGDGPPSFTNTPFDGGTTTFRISSTGRITPYSGVGTNPNDDNNNYWTFPDTYSTFIVTCHKLS